MESNQDFNRLNNNSQKEEIHFSYEKNEKENPLLIVSLGSSNQQKKNEIKINLEKEKMEAFKPINDYILKKISEDAEIIFLVKDNVKHKSSELKEVVEEIKSAYESEYDRIMKELESSYDVNI